MSTTAVLSRYRYLLAPAKTRINIENNDSSDSENNDNFKMSSMIQVAKEVNDVHPKKALATIARLWHFHHDASADANLVLVEGIA